MEEHDTPPPEEIRTWISEAIRQAGSRFRLGDRNCNVDVTYVSSDRIRDLNNTYRTHNQSTNALAFPAIGPDEELGAWFSGCVGDIVTCPEVMTKECEELQIPAVDHWAHVMVHATLHLCGMTHDNTPDQNRMFAAESAILRAVNRRDAHPEFAHGV